MPLQIVGFTSSLMLSSSEYEDLLGTSFSFTLPRTVVLPQVIALGASGPSELSMFSTGLGRFLFGGGFGGDEEEATVKGREKLAAKLEAKLEFARRKLRGFSGDVDKLCACWFSCSELA